MDVSCAVLTPHQFIIPGIFNHTEFFLHTVLITAGHEFCSDVHPHPPVIFLEETFIILQSLEKVCHALQVYAGIVSIPVMKKLGEFVIPFFI